MQNMLLISMSVRGLMGFVLPFSDYDDEILY